jgi:hypothetical protein
MATTTPPMKITYATLSADNEELQAGFDAASNRPVASSASPTRC